jgi:hypothetical protein
MGLLLVILTRGFNLKSLPQSPHHATVLPSNKQCNPVLSEPSAAPHKTLCVLACTNPLALLDAVGSTGNTTLPAGSTPHARHQLATTTLLMSDAATPSLPSPHTRVAPVHGSCSRCI